jgi:uncharacterized protein
VREFLALHEHTVRIPMPDGVELDTGVYRPAASGRFPVLLMRTPYGRRAAETVVFPHPSSYTRQGFAVVVQDVRGRFDSGGAFDPFLHEAEDGAQTIAWCGDQKWSNGRVGMYGFSYPGVVQLLAAALRPPALRAIAPALAPSGLGEGMLFNGGAFALGFAAGWALDLGADLARRAGRSELVAAFLEASCDRGRQYRYRPLLEHALLAADADPVVPFYREWLENERSPEYWHARSALDASRKVEVPSLHVGGLFDPFLATTLTNFNSALTPVHAPNHREHRLVIGPWTHYPGASAGAIPDDRREPFNTSHLAFFRRYLADEEVAGATSSVQIYVTGGVGWQSFDRWPPESQTLRFYLSSGGNANSADGGGLLGQEAPGSDPEDVFVYDPRFPVMATDSLGGGYPLLTPQGPVDQGLVESCQGVLVYSTRPLERPFVVVGNVVATLYAWSSAVDTDFVATLCDVDKDCRSVNLVRGIVRARTVLEGAPASDGVREYTISLGPLAHAFQPRHRIRLQVTSSCFPCWEPNPNSGAPLGSDSYSGLVTATQAILHSSRFPSRVELPLAEVA